jgi:DNA-binding PadR family transcriptional regulator
MSQAALGNLPFHVLLALADGAPLHGYGIGKDVQERSGGALRPTTGGLYLALKRLQEDGLIVRAEAPESPDRRRQYFRITDRGKGAATMEAGRLDQLVQAAKDKNLFPRSA